MHHAKYIILLLDHFVRMGPGMDLFCNDIKNKNGGYSVGLCMEGLWRGWHFAIIGMKKLQDIFERGI